MDKKKVKELIKNAIDSIITEKDPVNAIDTLIKADKELSKSDWVSVEDGLPPYNERVLVRCGNTGLETVEVRHNYLECVYPKLLDSNGFLDSYNVTHWKTI